MNVRAFGRIGTSYEKLGDLAQAVTNYQKSLTEHRTPEILNKLRAAEKAKIVAEKEAYINPEEAEKARDLGNQKFKEADWPGAVEAYTEMTKRAPDDPRGYSNRAAALIKLMTFPGAVADCDEAIKRDPKFIRAYLRKAQAYFAMKEYSKCQDVCEEAMQHDEGGANYREIEQQQQKALQAQFAGREGETEEQTMERIQRDPEVNDCNRSTAWNGADVGYIDHGYSARSCDAEHPPAGKGRSRCLARPYEERRHQNEDSEIGGSWRDPDTLSRGGVRSFVTDWAGEAFGGVLADIGPCSVACRVPLGGITY